MLRRLLSIAIVASIIFAMVALTTTSIKAESDPLVIIQISPGANETTSNSTPTIYATYYSGADINPDNVKMFVDGVDVSDWDGITTKTPAKITYNTPKIYEMKDGNHTIKVAIQDNAGIVLTKTWTIHVDSTIKTSSTTAINVQEIMIYIIIIAGIAGAMFGGYYIYLRKRKRFTLKKYFIKNPVKRGYLIILVPVIVAIVFVMFGLLFVSGESKSNPFGPEYVLIIALFIGVGPFAIDSVLEKKRITNYEKAFSQFLFELADAIRGGIDPAKAVIEFAKVDKGIMKKHLKAASDGIRIGRPFEDMIMVMVDQMGSPLIKRYASLIGESSKIGGDIAVVIHRAAKDMDDLLKIEEERRRNLMMQATTIYISFGVLIIVIYQLVDIYPTLGNGIGGGLSGLGQSGLKTDTATAVASTKMSFLTLKQRFFHLALINSLGAGLLIGTFTEGKVKMGLIHALIMIVATTVFFSIMIFPR
jgi:pilus assembly protein TadC